MLTQYLLEEPIPLVVILGIVAFVLWVMGMQTRRRGYLIAGGLGGVIAVGVYLLAGWVVTEREVVQQRMRQFVEATSPVNVAVLRDLFDDHATFTGPNGSVWNLPRSIEQELEYAISRFGIEKQSIRHLAAELTDSKTSIGRLGIHTTLSGDSYFPVNTQWLLTWRKQGDGQWRIIDVQWLKFQGQSPSHALWR